MKSPACNCRRRRLCFAANRRARSCGRAQRTDVGDVLADGGWWATVEGKGTAIDRARHGRSRRRRGGIACRAAAARRRSTRERSRVILDAVPGTRSVFRLSMPPATDAPTATLEPSDITAVRVCRASIPALPATGALEVGAEHDGWFGAGWHLGERGGTQRFRWSQRASTLVWRMERAAPVRMLLRLRAANANGATIQAAINGSRCRRARCRRARGPIARLNAGERDARGHQSTDADRRHDVAVSRSSGRCARARVRDAGQPRSRRPVVTTALATMCKRRSRSCRRWSASPPPTS